MPQFEQDEAQIRNALYGAVGQAEASVSPANTVALSSAAVSQILGQEISHVNDIGRGVKSQVGTLVTEAISSLGEVGRHMEAAQTQIAGTIKSRPGSDTLAEIDSLNTRLQGAADIREGLADTSEIDTALRGLVNAIMAKQRQAAQLAAASRGIREGVRELRLNAQERANQLGSPGRG